MFFIRAVFKAFLQCNDTSERDEELGNTSEQMILAVGDEA
jgi:hypothetical protein